MGGRYRQVCRCSRNALLRVHTENDEIHFSQVCEIQNPFRRVTIFDEVLGLAPGFRFRRHEFAEECFGGCLDVGPRNKVAGLRFGNYV